MVTPLNQRSLDFAPVVLIADDKRMIRELCREALEHDYVRVLTAANGEEALTLADRWILDVLVTDIAMPGLDGFGLLRALRRRYPGVSAIAMTADADYRGRSVQEVAAEHGIPWTLLKPFDVSLLSAAVRSLCNRQQAPSQDSRLLSAVIGERSPQRRATSSSETKARWRTSQDDPHRSRPM